MTNVFHFVSDSCEGQKCRVCGEAATHKVGEEVPDDEPCGVCGETWKLVKLGSDGQTLVTRDPDPLEMCMVVYHQVIGVPRHNLTAYLCCDDYRKIMGDAVPCENDDKPPYEDGFICGSGLDDPEHASWTHEVYETRDEAIAAGQEDVTWRRSDGFQTARLRCEKTFMPNPISAESSCDTAENSDMGETMMENWMDKVFGQNGKLIEELQATLDKVWDEFETKHKLWTWGLWMEDVEEHAFEDDGELRMPYGSPPKIPYYAPCPIPGDTTGNIAAPPVTRRESDGAYVAGGPSDGRSVEEHLAELTGEHAPTPAAK